jgi:PTH1 family peptidyl-tRNA hydrolase
VWIVVGLGNPGRPYARTRHNVGFRVLDLLADQWSAAISREAHRSLVGEARCGAERVLLVKPQTYMNAVGEAVASLRRFYSFQPSEFIAVHDDLDLSLGRVRVRLGGGTGGHRGVASLVQALADPAFLRIRVGIDRPAAGSDAAAYVLAPPAPEERHALTLAERRAAEAVALLVTEGPARTMNRINQREAPRGESSL